MQKLTRKKKNFILQGLLFTKQFGIVYNISIY